jgi:hypothetical protein
VKETRRGASLLGALRFWWSTAVSEASHYRRRNEFSADAETKTTTPQMKPTLTQSFSSAFVVVCVCGICVEF